MCLHEARGYVVARTSVATSSAVWRSGSSAATRSGAASSSRPTLAPPAASSVRTSGAQLTCTTDAFSAARETRVGRGGELRALRVARCCELRAAASCARRLRVAARTVQRREGLVLPEVQLAGALRREEERRRVLLHRLVVRGVAGLQQHHALRVGDERRLQPGHRLEPLVEARRRRHRAARSRVAGALRFRRKSRRRDLA